MYATIVEYDMHAGSSSHERGRVGRTLATLLGDIPGFVAFVALDVDAGAGRVAALCIFEHLGGIDSADHVINQWQQEHHGAVAAGIQRVGTGEVIVQKGL